MMGQQPRVESLFYYFRLEDQIPEDHLLRLLDRHVDFSFVRERLKSSYSPTGRPSIDPEVLLRLLLVGYLYGITSERRLLDEVRMHLAYRWFTRLGFEQQIPDHSTFSKNRHGRFRQSGVFREVFEEIVRRCVEAGLVDGQNLAVDGTMIGANASRQSRVPRERLQEAAQVSRTVREYLAELEQVNPVSDAEMVSTTDPDAILATKGGGTAIMAYYDNYLMDTASRVIVDVEATPALSRQEMVAACRMIERVEKLGLRLKSLGADNQFRYEPAENIYYCPEGKPLRYRGRRRDSQGYAYCSTAAQCQGCPQKQRCTAAPYRWLFVHGQESARQIVRSLAGTPAYERSQRARYKIEALFAELKQRVLLRRVRLRRLWNVAEQFLMAATGGDRPEFETAGAISCAAAGGACTKHGLRSKGARKKKCRAK